MPERPSRERASAEPAPEVQEVLFASELNRLQTITGSELPPLPAEPTENELNEAERALTGDNFVGTFSETYRVNEIQQRRNALQHRALLENPEAAPSLDRAELIAVNQAITYYEYMSGAVHDTIHIMRRYEQLRTSTVGVSPAIEIGEQQVAAFLHALNSALAERTSFANVLLIDAKLSKHAGDTPLLMRLREQYLTSADLSETSKRALSRGNDAKWRQGNALNQRIIEILAGTARIPGVDNGFLPQRLYIDLLKARYEEAFEEEKKAVRDTRMNKARARHEELSQKNNKAREGNGEPLTPEEGIEYERLRLILSDRNAYMDSLAEQRKDYQEEIIQFTCVLGDDQLNRAELVTIQHQFGDSFDFEGVSHPHGNQTPEEIRAAMGKRMEERSQFHLGRMQAFMQTMEDDVLGEGVGEWAEDISNKNGREAIRRANHVLTNLLVKLVPETFGMREAARNSLTQPLDAALGWPAGKESWEELTPEEQETVLQKSESVLDAIRAFDRTKIESFKGTVELIQGMPDASVYMDQVVTEPLPSDRVTAENRDQLIQQYGGATVYAMLFGQMDGDWNNFIGEYSGFLESVNQTVDVHIDVGEELHRMGDFYMDLMKYLLLAAAIGLGIGFIGGLAVAKVLKQSTKLAVRGAREGARLGYRGAKGVMNATRSGLDGLRQTHTAEQLGKLRYIERERRAALWFEQSKVGRAVGQKVAAFSNAKITQGSGRIVKVAGWAAIPAFTAYEYHLTNVRMEAIAGDEDLQREYESQKETVLLEGGGVASAMLVAGFIPSAALAAPVMYAADYNRSRSETLADWKRDVASYATEYDSAGLRGKIASMTDANAVEAGGAGALYPRIALPSEADQTEAFRLISDATNNAREAAYEAYFLQNLEVAPGTSDEEARTIILDKMNYLRVTSDGKFPAGMMNHVLLQADAYAQLMQRRRLMETAGESPVLSYEDEEGAHQIDLGLLTPGAGGDIRSLVSEYTEAMQPAEEVVLAITLGELAKQKILPSRQSSEMQNAQDTVRHILLSKLTHHIHQAESVIRSVDWPGVDSWVSSGNTETQNIVRTFLAHRIAQTVDGLVPQIIDGLVDPAVYADSIEDMQGVILELRNEKDADTFAEAASAYLKANGVTIQDDALGKLLPQ